MESTYFEKFRKNTIGNDIFFNTPFGKKKLLYADWIASGRLYAPIEEKMNNLIFPFCGNTHTETSVTGTYMTNAYHEAKEIIKKEVGANESDALIFVGSGMTGAINKLQRILGLRIPEMLNNFTTQKIEIDEHKKPIVFISHMEHHSNQTSWLETFCDVEIINPCGEGLLDIAHFKKLLEEYKHREIKIASITSCSNVTGITTPYYEIAKLIHQENGYCFVDFACSAPYVEINMHPQNDGEHLDAIFMSPHKFLGGPGTPGVLIFNSNLYKNQVPDQPGGGTVTYTNPWKRHYYITNIEEREDGGTPPFLQGIKTALCFLLKKEMGVENILNREHQIIEKIFDAFQQIENIDILASQHKERIGAISFCIKGLHYNLAVKLLNDHFGIQVRGGCACAGTYGHYLLNIDEENSNAIRANILNGVKETNPGWIRLSIHPTMTDIDVDEIINAISYVAKNFVEMSKDYKYMASKNEFEYCGSNHITNDCDSWLKELYHFDKQLVLEKTN